MATVELQKRTSQSGLSNTDNRRASLIKWRRGTLMGARKSIYMSRPSIWNMEKKLLQIQYENTYRTEAYPKEIFFTFKVKPIIEEELRKSLGKISYDHNTANELTKRLTEKIKFKVKELPSIRYKLVVHVVLGKKNAGGMCQASRALWNEKSGDNFAEASFSNDNIFAIATVFGIYYE